MNQENTAKTSEGTPQKWTRKDWVVSGTVWAQFTCVVLLFICLMIQTFRGTGPLRPVSLEGTIIILDENGEAIPYRDTFFTFYSHYAPGFFRSEASRKLNYYNDEQGFGKGFLGNNKFPLKIPKSAATLFFHTRNGKYAAVVDIDPNNDPATGLVVELRPRHSATGRLVDDTGAPLANYEFSLKIDRTPDFPSNLRTFFSGTYGPVAVETLESEYCETDADGWFTADRLIPGVEYSLSIHQPRNRQRYSKSVTMPILTPEQYQEPYSLGDVSVR